MILFDAKASTPEEPDAGKLHVRPCRCRGAPGNGHSFGERLNIHFPRFYRLLDRTLLAMLLAMLLVTLPPLFAAPATAPPPQSPATQGGSTLESHIAETEAALAALPAQPDPTQPAQPATAAEMERRGLLGDLLVAYQAQRSRQQELVDLKALPPAAPFEPLMRDTGGYSFLAVDRMREQAISLADDLESIRKGGELVSKELERGQEAIKGAEAQIRQASERLESANSPAAQETLRAQRDLSTLKARYQAARAAVVEVEGILAAERARQAQRRLDQVQANLAQVRGQVAFPASELEQILAGLAEERRRLGEALQQTAAATAQAQSAKSASPSETDRARTDNLVLKGRVLSLERRLLDHEEDVWRQRQALFQGKNPALRQSATEQLQQQGEEFALWREIVAQRLAQGHEQAAKQADLARRPGAGAEAAGQIELAALYRERVDLLAEQQQRVEFYVRLLERWRQDLAETAGEAPAGERVEARLRALWQGVLMAWNYEVFVVADQIEVDGQTVTGQRSVTVGKFATALLILVAGYWLSRLLSRRVERLAVSRLGLEPSRARVARRWADALGLVILAAIALTLVKIPLTIFTFLGGAVAIGIGFGTQTLFKNLISGLMILVERPFKLGDLVEVGAIRGRITDISLRASVIRDSSGIETLIPNATLLEQNVTNWTYSSTRVRLSVKVGVAYDAKPPEVRDMLKEVAGRHGQILKNPEPQVTLDDFGADALLFSLLFWVELTPDLDRALIQSDLRFMIATALTKASIGIPFPQREVRLAGGEPLTVRVVAEE
ncbi:putative Mechanosensitive ion channel family protein [Gammaproteobacteria bacterium]